MITEAMVPANAKVVNALSDVDFHHNGKPSSAYLIFYFNIRNKLKQYTVAKT
jgi:hypothetical protein